LVISWPIAGGMSLGAGGLLSFGCVGGLKGDRIVPLKDAEARDSAQHSAIDEQFFVRQGVSMTILVVPTKFDGLRWLRLDQPTEVLQQLSSHPEEPCHLLGIRRQALVNVLLLLTFLVYPLGLREDSTLAEAVARNPRSPILSAEELPNQRYDAD